MEGDSSNDNDGRRSGAWLTRWSNQQHRLLRFSLTQKLQFLAGSKKAHRKIGKFWWPHKKNQPEKNETSHRRRASYISREVSSSSLRQQYVPITPPPLLSPCKASQLPLWPKRIIFFGKWEIASPHFVADANKYLPKTLLHNNGWISTGEMSFYIYNL